VVGEELQCGGGRHDSRMLRGGGQFKDFVDLAFNVLVTASYDTQDRRISGAAFRHVAKHFVLPRAVVEHGNNRDVLFSKNDRPVFQSRGVIALGVDVGDLLTLERVFQRNRDADRIVSPILETFRAVEQDGNGRLNSCVCNDSAHNYLL